MVSDMRYPADNIGMIAKRERDGMLSPEEAVELVEQFYEQEHDKEIDHEADTATQETH